MQKYSSTFRRLIVWQKAKTLTLEIYRLTKSFPQEEKYGLVSQMRRAASSVMANIAEGNERPSKNDCVHFLAMAKGSLVEIDCFLDLAFALHYISDAEYQQTLDILNITAYLLRKFVLSQDANIQRK